MGFWDSWGDDSSDSLFDFGSDGDSSGSLLGSGDTFGDVNLGSSWDDTQSWTSGDISGLDTSSSWQDVVGDDTQYDWFNTDTSKLFDDVDMANFNGLGDLGETEGEKGGGISGGVWSKLLDFGLGGLSQWLKEKNTSKKTASKRSGGGGGGPPPAVEAVTKAIKEGTRTKE